jgi:hypothetical protein
MGRLSTVLEEWRGLPSAILVVRPDIYIVLCNVHRGLKISWEHSTGYKWLSHSYTQIVQSVLLRVSTVYSIHKLT